jgi:hypothetical protein
LGFQVKNLSICAWSGFFLLLCSCQSSKPNKSSSENPSSFSGNTVLGLGAEKVQIQKKLQASNLELEWLEIRKLIVEAQIRSDEARRSEIILESEFLKFQAIEDRFPSDKGFITEGKRIEWLARLKVKNAETKRQRAAVRLLSRDMKELEAKLFRKGFHYQLPNPRVDLSANSHPK